MKRIMVCLAGAGAIILACNKSNDFVTMVDCIGAAKSFVTDFNPIIQANGS